MRKKTKNEQQYRPFPHLPQSSSEKSLPSVPCKVDEKKPIVGKMEKRSYVCRVRKQKAGSRYRLYSSSPLPETELRKEKKSKKKSERTKQTFQVQGREVNARQWPNIVDIQIKRPTIRAHSQTHTNQTQSDIAPIRLEPGPRGRSSR